MGLKKEKVTDFGVTAEYWKVTEFHFYATNGGMSHPLRAQFDGVAFLDVEMSLFLDRLSSKAGLSPMGNVRFSVAFDCKDEDDIIRQIYKQSDTCEDLAGAVDVLEE